MVNKRKFLASLKEAGLTQEELAGKSNISRATISRIIKDGYCTIRTAEELALALNLSSEKAGEIFFGELVANMRQIN